MLLTPLRDQGSRYQLVYDAAAAGYTDWWFPAAGLALLLVLSVLFIYGLKRRVGESKIRIAYVGVPFLGLWVGAAFLGTYRQYASLRDRLRSGQYTTVEGRVSYFRPSDWGDHVEERWSVESGGKLYTYHYVRSSLTPGFRQTAVHGGPIREGLRVRIADIDGFIARLEIAR